MKKRSLRAFALILVLLLALPTAGCLNRKQQTQTQNSPAATGPVAAPGGFSSDASQRPDPENEPDDPAASQSTDPEGEPVDPDAFDASAAAIELGDTVITAGEVQDAFNEFVAMFAYSYGLDEESLNQFLRMTEESLVSQVMPQWKAKQLGLTLSEAEKAEIEAKADRLIEEERNEILLIFADAYTDGVYEDASMISEAHLAVVNDAIKAELEEMFGEGYTFDDYLAMRREGYVFSLLSDRYTELLRMDSCKDLFLDPAAVDERYEAALAAQKEAFDADLIVYLDSRNDKEADEEFRICLYVPAETAHLEVIRIPVEETDDRIAEMTDALTALEAEYGALALNGEDEARQAEIVAEYAAQKEALETIKADLEKSSQHRIESAYADLAGGMSFEDAMCAYNEPDEDGVTRIDIYILADTEDPIYPELQEAVASLAPGAYSEPIRAEDEYVIVRLVERIPAGVVDRASVEEQFREMLLGSATEAEWEAQSDAWLAEAMEAAIFHRETYESIIDVYLSYDYGY